MIEESQHVGTSSTWNLIYRYDANYPTGNPQPEEEWEAQEQVNQPVMTVHIRVWLVNPFHNTIDISITEGKNLYQKEMRILLIDEKCSGNSKGIIKIFERVEAYGGDFGLKKVCEGIGVSNISSLKTPDKLAIYTIKVC